MVPKVKESLTDGRAVIMKTFDHGGSCFGRDHGGLVFVEPDEDVEELLSAVLVVVLDKDGGEFLSDVEDVSRVDVLEELVEDLQDQCLCSRVSVLDELGQNGLQVQQQIFNV